MPTPKKPRVRKAAPSIREIARETEAKQQKAASKPSKHRARIPASLTNSPGIKGAKKALGFLRWLVPKYFVNSWREVRQVVWPTRKETWRLTLAVFIFAIVFGALVAGVDKSLDILFKKLVLR